MGVAVVGPLRGCQYKFRPDTRLLTVSLIKIRSIRNKSATFADFINSNKSDVIAVTETWLKSNDTDSFITSVTSPCYKVPMFHILRVEAVMSGTLSTMLLISRSYLNHVSIHLRAYQFTCPWAMPRTLFFIFFVQASQCLQSQFHGGFQLFHSGC